MVVVWYACDVVGLWCGTVFVLYGCGVVRLWCGMVVVWYGLGVVWLKSGRFEKNSKNIKEQCSGQ